MDMAGVSRPSLPEWITDAYAVLYDHITDSEPSECRNPVLAIDRERAVEVLLADDELALEREDAEYALTRLLDRGYFYAVDDELRVTSPSK